MASREGRTLRFGVGSPQNPRSAVWRLWVEGSEVYLAARSLRGLFKVSLHSSRIWRAAWSEESRILSPGISNRLEMKWKRPAEFTAGWTQGPSVIVPGTAVQEPLGMDDDLKPSQAVVWAPAPANGDKLIFTLLFSRPTIPADGWRKVLQEGDGMIGSLPLANGETVWVSTRRTAVTEYERHYIDGFVRETRIHPAGNENYVTGASLFILSEEIVPVIVNVLLGKEHVIART